jgi:hypothetical protein
MRIQEGSLEEAECSEKEMQVLAEAERLGPFKKAVRRVTATRALDALTEAGFSWPDRMEGIYEFIDFPQHFQKSDGFELITMVQHLGFISFQLSSKYLSNLRGFEPVWPLTEEEREQLKQGLDLTFRYIQIVKDQETEFCSKNPLLRDLWYFATIAEGNFETYKELVQPYLPQIQEIKSIVRGNGGQKKPPTAHTASK